MIKAIKKLFNSEKEQGEKEKVLYIKANPKAENKSFGLQVGRSFIEEYKKSNPMDEVIEIDVYKEYIPLIDGDILEAWDKLMAGGDFAKLDKKVQDKLTRFNELTEQFLSADKYVFVTPMWNLAMPAMMKAYIDTFVVAGKTFKYTENGPVGLLENKKAVHIYATGGVYSEGPAKAFDNGNSYLQTILGFVGVTDLQTIFVEGMAAAPDKVEEIKAKATKQAIEVAKKL